MKHIMNCWFWYIRGGGVCIILLSPSVIRVISKCLLSPLLNYNSIISSIYVVYNIILYMTNVLWQYIIFDNIIMTVTQRITLSNLCKCLQPIIIVERHSCEVMIIILVWHGIYYTSLSNHNSGNYDDGNYDKDHNMTWDASHLIIQS